MSGHYGISPHICAQQSSLPRHLRPAAPQQEVADYLGTSQTMYARYERGANELPIRHLIRLCEYYHVSSDYFLGLSQNKKGPAGHRR